MSAADESLTRNLLGAALTDAQFLSAHEAANFLQISPETLRTWEEEFGFPAALKSDPAPNYPITELLALHDALPHALSITSAIHAARRSITEAT